MPIETVSTSGLLSLAEWPLLDIHDLRRVNGDCNSLFRFTS